jgi:hypothetical protein
MASLKHFQGSNEIFLMVIWNARICNPKLLIINSTSHLTVKLLFEIFSILCFTVFAAFDKLSFLQPCCKLRAVNTNICVLYKGNTTLSIMTLSAKGHVNDTVNK